MMRLAGALLSAVLLSCCFPSNGLWWLAWLAFAPFLISLRPLDRKASFGAGYLTGCLFFFLTLFWLHHVTWIGLILLSAYLALYWAVFAWAVAFSSAWTLMRRVLFLPAVWASCEFVRAHAFTGFGWSALAHTQSTNILLIQMADVAGTYGVSFLLMAFNVVVAEAFVCRGRINVEDRKALYVVVLLVTMAWVYGAWRLSSLAGRSPIRVALVQGNVSLVDYWDPQLKPYVIEKHLALSRQALEHGPELIVWPETSFPQFIWDYPELFEKVCVFAREHHVKLMLGAVTRRGEQYFNTAILINEAGVVEDMYRKQHLVILGEYIPFRKELPWLVRFAPIDDFTPGQGQVLLNGGRGRSFSALICFEDTLPELARAAVNSGAGFLVNITNDGWFDPSRQSLMHLDNAIFRAVENRVTLLRATNTGMSCAVLPTGERGACVQDVAGQAVMSAGVVVVDVPATVPEKTFYRKYGDIFAMLCFIGILGMIFIKEFKREKENV